MKTLITTLGLLVCTLGNANTNDVRKNLSDKPISEKPVKTKTIVYLWKMNTSKGEFTGTSRSVNGSNREMANLAKGKKVYSKSIVPVKVNPSATNKVYVWEAKTQHGYARGICETHAQAKSAIKKMSKGEVVNSKIVESFIVD